MTLIAYSQDNKYVCPYGFQYCEQIGCWAHQLKKKERLEENVKWLGMDVISSYGQHNSLIKTNKPYLLTMSTSQICPTVQNLSRIPFLRYMVGLFPWKNLAKSR